MSTSATTSAKRRRAGPLTVQPVPPGPSLSRAPGRAVAGAAPTSSPSSVPPPPVSTRGPVQPSQPPSVPSPVASTAPSIRPLTVQQAISVIDGRLLTLEKIALEQQSGRSTSETAGGSPEAMQTLLHEHLSEFNHRYELLATELMELKETVMKLQSYTMDINKALINERIQILSDIPAHPQIGLLQGGEGEDNDDNNNEDDGEINELDSVTISNVGDEAEELTEHDLVEEITNLTEPITQDMMDAEALLRGLRLST